MNFWEAHRGALTVTGTVLFLLLVAYLAAIRPALAESDQKTREITTLGKELEPFFPEINSNGQPVHRKTLSEVRDECRKKREKYLSQIESLKKQLRFPFEQFKYWQVPADEKYPGMWLSKRYSLVQLDVESQCIQANLRGLPARLDPKWLGFAPSATPDKVTKAQAEEELRKLCLAERVTLLAIESGVSRVLRVEPQNRTEEGATFLAPNPAWKRNSNHPRMIVREYDNKFIDNYPVRIVMVGSLDSVMKFVHKVQQKLVVRHFRVLSREELGTAGSTMRTGEVQLELSAAYMDFKTGEAVKQPKTPPKFVVPLNPPD